MPLGDVGHHADDAAGPALAVALDDAAAAYDMFQKKHDGAVKVVFNPA